MLVGGTQHKDYRRATLTVAILPELRIRCCPYIHLRRRKKRPAYGDVHVPFKHGKIDNRQKKNLGNGRKVCQVDGG